MLTQTEKILIYSLAVIVFEEKLYWLDEPCSHRVGICFVIRSMKYCDEDLIRSLSPGKSIGKYWFPLTYSGYKQRIKLLKKAIKQANKIP